MQALSYISLKQLLLKIQSGLRTSVPGTYWIQAEVAGVRRVRGHIYFDLIQLERGLKVAQIKTVAFWGEGALAVQSFEEVTGQKFIEGIKVGVRVSVNYHPVYGLSLVLQEVDPELTLGGIELQRKRTLERVLQTHSDIVRLVAGEYLTPNKGLALPRVIQRIALVTSVSSDAYNDFRHCLGSNEYGYGFQIDDYNVQVQGYNSLTTLLEAFQQIRQSHTPYDVVVLTRGGGSPADFMPFDSYDLAMTIATYPIPVITGIGHYLNQGIADFFARVHTKTPSIAAQFILDHNHNSEKKLIALSGSIRNKASELLVKENSRFQQFQSAVTAAVKDLTRHASANLALMQASIFPGARELLMQQQSQLNSRQLQLNSKVKVLLYGQDKILQEKQLSLRYLSLQQLREEKQKTGYLKEHLLALLPKVLLQEKRKLLGLKENLQNASPERIMQRGFAILKKDGKVISSAEAIKEGDQLQVIQDRYQLDTEVKIKTDYDGREFNL